MKKFKIERDTGKWTGLLGLTQQVSMNKLLKSIHCTIFNG
jgi:hypothetical protein